MKRLVPTIMAAFGILALSTGKVESANTNAVPVQFTLTGWFNPTNTPTSTTNTSFSKTVITTKYSASTIKLVTKDFLRMLQLEYGTFFPTGAQLAYGLSGPMQGHFQVLDSSGNFIMDVSTNVHPDYVFSLSSEVISNFYDTAIIGKILQTNSVKTNVVESLTEMADNYAVFYKDTHGNDFYLAGWLRLTVTAYETNNGAIIYKPVSFAIKGSGGGSFYNINNNQINSAVFTNAQMTASSPLIIQ